ncbi:MAG: outer membrane lipoprotein-sorting protein [Candidatus Omnitrophica bacterium]|nr:outer membrane lipoprotein-sorting protein [Candidatus Omnitrophota bacterium]
MKRILSLLLAAGLTLFFSGSSFAEVLSAEQIVKKANEAYYYQGDNGRSRVNMKIEDRQGNVREKEFVILRLNIVKGGPQKYYVYYEKPNDVRGTVFMVWKYLDKDDDRWLYLPGLNLVNRIAASDKRSSFAGSNFVYEDISGRNLNYDKHELIDDKGDVYVIKGIPKVPSEVEFAYYISNINKENFIPVKVEYYDNQDKVIRILETKQIIDVQGYPTVKEAVASDLRSGGKTIIDFNDVEYDIGLDEDVFTERYLQRPPMKWLK